MPKLVVAKPATVPGWPKVKLFTDTMQFVHEQYMPPFNRTPDVLFWGERVFYFESLVNTGNESFACYKEAFTYALVPNDFEEIPPESVAK